ncbi:hypothetical protein [Prochlorococcus sp. MIT 1011]|uniref:hypothetical protein n=1 Tax=Prochlorococcus sp. MIT 1011 TaxID=3082520 RepID=UPI0039B4D7ED
MTRFLIIVPLCSLIVPPEHKSTGKDRQTAHGFRKLPATAGQDVLKFPYEVISRQGRWHTQSGTK